MTLSTTLLNDPMITQLATVLLHFVWQGCLFALAAMLAMWVLRNAVPQFRYLMLLSLFALMAASPIITFFVIPDYPSIGRHEPIVVHLADEGRRFIAPPELDFREKEPLAAAAPSPKVAPTPPPSIDPGQVSIARFELLQADRAPWRSWVVVAWGAGVVLLLIRLLYGLAAAEWLKRRGVRPLDEASQTIFKRLCRQLGIWQSVPVFESLYVKVPTLVGYFKPVILMPTSALLGLTPQQFEAILAHELAHIARRDYLANLLQCVVETLLFYHPAVWWISHRIRQERELCCDDVATAMCTDRRDYAKAICIVAHSRGESPALVLTATGSPLVRRIRRLLEREPKKPRRNSGWIAVSLLASAVLLLGLGLQVTVAGADDAPSTMELHMDAGIVDIEMFDPRVKIEFDSDTGVLSILGAGPNEVRIKLGPKQFPTDPGASNDWLTITRANKPVVRFRLRSISEESDEAAARDRVDVTPLTSTDPGSDVPPITGTFDPGGRDPQQVLDEGIALLKKEIAGAKTRKKTLEAALKENPFDIELRKQLHEVEHEVETLQVRLSRAKSVRFPRAEKDIALRKLAFFKKGGSVPSLAFLPDGKRVITGGDAGDTRLLLWNIEENEAERYFPVGTSCFFVAASPDGRYIANAGFGSHGQVMLWDVSKWEVIRKFKHGTLVTCLAFSPDGRQLVSGGTDSTLCVWNVADGSELLRFEGHEKWVSSVVVTPDGRSVLSGSNDRTARVWNIETGEELFAVSHPAPVWSVAVSPDGRYFATGTGGEPDGPMWMLNIKQSDDNRIRYWGMWAGKLRREMTGHTHVIKSLAFTPDTQRLLSGSFDGSLRLWNVKNGSEITRIQGEGWVTSVDISPDGHRVITGGGVRKREGGGFRYYSKEWLQLYQLD